MSGNLGHKKRATGDYQTPPEFCREVCQYLRQYCCHHPAVIFEPTCGEGNFLDAAAQVWNRANVKDDRTPSHGTERIRLIGLEISQMYLDVAREKLLHQIPAEEERTTWIHEDFFQFDFRNIRPQTYRNDSWLVIGNPPWVMSSTLTSLDASNPVTRSNFKRFRGLDAITGSANFDICEAVILRLSEAFLHTNTLIAMLCKTSVARSVFQELWRRKTPVARYRMIRINARKIFGITADACLFLIKLTSSEKTAHFCDISDFENPNVTMSSFGIRGGRFYASLDTPESEFDGICCFEWRQGIKHDCAGVMELTPDENGYRNKASQSVTLEDTYLFPLMKSSDFRSPITTSYRRQVLVTQFRIGDPTNGIQRNAPNTWKYLCDHREDFEKRKSVIYRNAPPFGIFGVGEYTFARFKVGVSGFYKTPLFSLLTAPKPVMLDDTGYFLAFDNYEYAYTTMLILNSTPVQEFLRSIACLDAKRPWTKKVLERLDMTRVVHKMTLKMLCETETELGLESHLRSAMFADFIALVKQLTPAQR